MIKDKKIFVGISYRNLTHYLRLGYKPIIGEELEINTTDLPSVSHVKVIAVCEICGNEKNLMYCKYVENCKRHGFYGCKKCSRQKAVITSRQIYGVDNWMQLEESKETMKKRNLDKYGEVTTLLLPDVKEKIGKTMLEKYGTDKWFEIRRPNTTKKFTFLDLASKEFEMNVEDKYSDISMESIRNYRNEVRRITKHNSKLLFENWDGTDFYDGENIYENFNLEPNDKNYPTIDHKISIYHGYMNGISVETISDISNLCITKRTINSKKRDLCINFDISKKDSSD